MALDPSTSSYRRAAFAAVTAAGLLFGSAAHAQTVAATPVVNAPTSPAAPVASVIPQEQCNYLADFVVRSLESKGKGLITATTKRSLREFFAADAKGVPTCAGSNREIAWERGDDYDFVIAMADSAWLAFGKKTDFRMGYGIKPAARPTAAATPGQRSEITTVPKVN